MSEFDRLSESGSIPQMDLDTELPWERAARTALAVDTDLDARSGGSEFQEIRTRVHRKLIERLNLSTLSTRDEEEAVTEVRKIVRDLLDSEAISGTAQGQAQLTGRGKTSSEMLGSLQGGLGMTLNEKLKTL